MCTVFTDDHRLIYIYICLIKLCVLGLKVSVPLTKWYFMLFHAWALPLFHSFENDFETKGSGGDSKCTERPDMQLPSVILQGVRGPIWTYALKSTTTDPTTYCLCEACFVLDFGCLFRRVHLLILLSEMNYHCHVEGVIKKKLNITSLTVVEVVVSLHWCS